MLHNINAYQSSHIFWIHWLIWTLINMKGIIVFLSGRVFVAWLKGFGGGCTVKTWDAWVKNTFYCFETHKKHILVFLMCFMRVSKTHETHNTFRMTKNKHRYVFHAFLKHAWNTLKTLKCVFDAFFLRFQTLKCVLTHASHVFTVWVGSEKSFCWKDWETRTENWTTPKVICFKHKSP